MYYEAKKSESDQSEKEKRERRKKKSKEIEVKGGLSGVPKNSIIYFLLHFNFLVSGFHAFSASRAAQ